MVLNFDKNSVLFVCLAQRICNDSVLLKVIQNAILCCHLNVLVPATCWQWKVACVAGQSACRFHGCKTEDGKTSEDGTNLIFSLKANFFILFICISCSGVY